MSLTVGSLFAGIGGFDLGLELAGFKMKWHAEIEPFPSAVLKHHWPGVPNLGDVTAADFLDRAEPVDLICGGSPCQAFSVAGLGKSLDDDRGKLTLRFVEICLALRPTWIVWENVPGVLNTEDNAFGCFLGGLAGADSALVPPGGKWPGHGLVLGQDYRLAWTIKDAQYFGVPQQRRRVLLVGSLGDWACAEALFPVRQGLQRHPAPGRKAGQEIAGTLGGSSKSGGFRTTDLDNSGAFIPMAQACSQIARTLKHDPYCDRSDGSEAGGLVCHTLTTRHDSSEDGSGRGLPLVPWAFNWANGGGYGEAHEGLGIRRDKTPPHSCSQVAAVAFETRLARNGRGAPSEVVPPLKAQSGGSGKGDAAPCVAYTLHGSDKTASTSTRTKVAGSIRTKPPGSIENSSTTIALNGMAVRRLTPLECARLQGFPDNWLLQIKWKGQKPPKDSPMYKALGNAVNKKVAEWLGRRIREAAA